MTTARVGVIDTDQTDGGTSLTFTNGGASIPVGAEIFVMAAIRDDSDTPTSIGCTDDGSNSYSVASHSGNQITIVRAKARLTTALANGETITLSWTGTTYTADGVAEEWSADGELTLGETNQNDASSTTLDSGSITPAHTPSLITYGAARRTTTGFTQDTDYTSAWTGDGATNGGGVGQHCVVYGGYYLDTVGDANNAAPTADSGTQAWAMQIEEWYEAAGGDDVAITGVLGTLSGTGQTGTVTAQGNQALTGALGTLALAGQAGAILAQGNQFVTGALGQLSLAGGEATLAIGQQVNIAVSGRLGTLSLAGQVAAVAAQQVENVAVSGQAGTLELTGLVLGVTAEGNEFVSGVVGTLSLAGQTPDAVATFLQSVALTGVLGQVSIAGQTSLVRTFVGAPLRRTLRALAENRALDALPEARSVAVSRRPGGVRIH